MSIEYNEDGSYARTSHWLIDKIQERFDILDQLTRGKLRVVEVRLHPADWMLFIQLLEEQAIRFGRRIYPNSFPEFCATPVTVCATVKRGMPQLVV